MTGNNVDQQGPEDHTVMICKIIFLQPVIFHRDQ